MSNEIHKTLGRVRKPRVHITYEVETNGATELRELPFKIGVIGDYSGNNPGKEKKALAERKFIDITKDNFNNVLEGITPGLSFKVDNLLGEEVGVKGEQIPIDLKFKSMEDFEPTQIVKQVEPLRKLLETRSKLRDIMTKADISPELEKILEDLLQNPDKLSQLKEQIEANKSADPEPEEKS